MSKKKTGEKGKQGYRIERSEGGLMSYNSMEFLLYIRCKISNDNFF